MSIRWHWACLASFPICASQVAWADDPRIVFAARQIDLFSSPQRITGAIEKASRGELMLREPDGSLHTLVGAGSPSAPPETPADVMDPDVNYDAKRIVFAGFSAQDQAWRIFEVNADGSGLHQVTHTGQLLDLSRYGDAAESLKSHDDVDPCYLPDGRICFVSTRYPGIAPDNRLRTTNLYVVNVDGSGLHRITTERFAADTPAVDPVSGRIVYSRWWRTPEIGLVDGTTQEPVLPGSPEYQNTADQIVSGPAIHGIDEASFPGVNSWFLALVNPDGTGLEMFSGFRLDRRQTQAYRPSVLSNGTAIALFIPRTPILGMPGGNGLRLFQRGPAIPAALGGPQQFGESFAGEFGLIPEGMPFANLNFAGASALQDGRILLAAADISQGQAYGIYILDSVAEMRMRVIYLNAGSSVPLDPVALEPRALPPVVEDGATDVLAEDTPRSVEEAFGQGKFTFKCENIFFNSPIDKGIATAPPIGKRLEIEFYMSPQRAGVTSADPPLLIHRETVNADGKIEVDLPAGVPLFEILRRPDNTIAAGRDGQIFHVGGLNFGRAGKDGKCVGCHTGHSMQEVPDDASWTNLAPSAALKTNAADAFPPEVLVDRSTQPGRSVWFAQSLLPETVIQLQWSIPLRGQQVMVHSPQPDGSTPAQRIRGFTVQTFLGEELREEVQVDRGIQVRGTAAVLSESLEFDTLKVKIAQAKVGGIFQGVDGPALSEIEVIAKAADPAAIPQVNLVRGDPNCDGNVNLSDALGILDSLFLEAGAPCCGEAADVDADGFVNLTDSISLLSYLFRGDRPPAQPFPFCGSVPETSGTCEAATACVR
jgi:hypothetical protein